MREIVFDTETTGTTASAGDRIVEIGCVELVNKVETGRTFHAYFNPDRAMSSGAQAVHGLSDQFLADKPRFADRVADLIDFFGECPLVAHNAEFDFSFLDAEFDLCAVPRVCRSRMVDTIVLAKKRHPGAKFSLDALCTRFGVDRSARVKHGALLDAQLLAQVYVELSGGRQIGFSLAAELSGEALLPELAGIVPPRLSRPFRAPRRYAPSEAELAAHAAFVSRLTDPLWPAVLARD